MGFYLTGQIIEIKLSTVLSLLSFLISYKSNKVTNLKDKYFRLEITKTFRESEVLQSHLQLSSLLI